MRKIIIGFLLLLISCIPVSSAEAKVKTKRWSTRKATAKHSYSFGMNSLYKKYYPLRGDMWVYSGDTFGFEYGKSWMYDSKNWRKQKYQIKITIKIIKGKGKLYLNYDVSTGGAITVKNENYSEIVKGIEGGWVIWQGKAKPICKKGCTVQFKYQTRLLRTKNWKTSIFKVRVKK